MQQQPSKCRWCGAAVIWASHHRTEKAAPLDAELSDGGNCLYDVVTGCYRVLSKQERESGEYIGRVRTSHWQTCSKAAEHKR